MDRLELWDAPNSRQASQTSRNSMASLAARTCEFDKSLAPQLRSFSWRVVCGGFGEQSQHERLRLFNPSTAFFCIVNSLVRRLLIHKNPPDIDMDCKNDSVLKYHQSTFSELEPGTANLVNALSD